MTTTDTDLLEAARAYLTHFDSRASVPPGNGFAAWVHEGARLREALREAIAAEEDRACGECGKGGK